MLGSNDLGGINIAEIMEMKQEQSLAETGLHELLEEEELFLGVDE